MESSLRQLSRSPCSYQGSTLSHGARTIKRACVGVLALKSCPSIAGPCSKHWLADDHSWAPTKILGEGGKTKLTSPPSTSQTTASTVIRHHGVRKALHQACKYIRRSSLRLRPSLLFWANTDNAVLRSSTPARLASSPSQRPMGSRSRKSRLTLRSPPPSS